MRVPVLKDSSAIHDHEQYRLHFAVWKTAVNGNEKCTDYGKIKVYHPLLLARGSGGP